MDAEEIYGNTLYDGWTGTRCGLTMCPDEAAGGPLACLTCTRYAASGSGSSSSYGHASVCEEPVEDPVNEGEGAGGSCSPGISDQEIQDVPETPVDLLTNVDIREGEQDAPAAARARARSAPSGKEVAMAKRRHRKRQSMKDGHGEDRAEARAKLENQGADGSGTGESSRQDHGNIYSQEGGPTMAENMEEKKGAGYMADLAAEALRIVNGDRQREYGEPEHNFSAIANMWNAYIAGIDRYLTPADVANMMMLFKLARNATGTGTQDTDIDLLGYALLSADLRRRQLARHDKEDAAKDIQQ